MHGGDDGTRTRGLCRDSSWFRVLSKTAEVWRFRNSELSIRMVAGFAEIAEKERFLSCGGLQPSELFSAAL
jgi:hypothetical protein